MRPYWTTRSGTRSRPPQGDGQGHSIVHVCQKLTLTLDPTSVAVDDNGLQELVCLVLLIALLNGLDGVLGLLALTLDKAVDGDLDSLPTLVTVHGVVASDDGGDFTYLLLLYECEEIFHVPCGRSGCGVATIAEEVDVDFLEADLLRGLEECV